MTTAAIQTFTLSDTDTNSSATIAPARGAIVTSLKLQGRELLYMDESTLIDPDKNVRGGIPVLFPSPGKLTNDAWSYAGHSGAMKQHGFARTQPWRIVASDAHELQLELQANEVTLAQYPWLFAARLGFRLQDAVLRITTTIQNRDSTPLPFALGFHPYFRVDDKSGLQIASRATRAFNNVTRQIEPFKGFDFTQTELDLHLLDHRDNAATLFLGDGARIEVRASPEFSVWVFWSLAGKEFVCVEPWTAQGNALNSGVGLTSVAPGQDCELWMEVALR